jgi:hypothetical protein
VRGRPARVQERGPDPTRGAWGTLQACGHLKSVLHSSPALPGPPPPGPSDQRVYVQDVAPGAAARALTPEGAGLRFADYAWDAPRARLLAVCEDHSVAGEEASNYIAAIGGAGGGGGGSGGRWGDRAAWRLLAVAMGPTRLWSSAWAPAADPFRPRPAPAPTPSPPPTPSPRHGDGRGHQAGGRARLLHGAAAVARRHPAGLGAVGPPGGLWRGWGGWVKKGKAAPPSSGAEVVSGGRGRASHMAALPTHPAQAMPWDATELVVAPVTADGTLGEGRCGCATVRAGTAPRPTRARPPRPGPPSLTRRAPASSAPPAGSSRAAPRSLCSSRCGTRTAPSTSSATAPTGEGQDARGSGSVL